MFWGLVICVIAAAGIVTYSGMKYFRDNVQHQSEMLGESIVEFSDEDVPLAYFSDVDGMFALRDESLKVIDLVNAERTKAGAGELSESDLLYSAASVRAAELEELFSHNRPDGKICFTVLNDFNITSKARAENIASGHSSPEQVVEAWMKSDGHKKNILNPAFNNIGVGVYEDSSGKLLWVQLFTD